MIATAAAIALHPVQHRKSQGSLWLTWTLAAGAVIFAAMLWWHFLQGRDTVSLSVITAIPWVALLMLWGAMFARSLREQASPAALRLVPAMRTRILAVAGGVVLAAASFSAIVIGVPAGHPGFVFVAACLLLVEMPLLQGWRAGAVFALSLAAANGLIPLPAQALLSAPAIAVGLVLVVVEGRNAVLSLVGTGRSLPRQPAAVPLRQRVEAGLVGPRETKYDSPDKLLEGVLGQKPDQRSLGWLAGLAVAAALASRSAALSRWVEPQVVVQIAVFFVLAMLFAFSEGVVGRVYRCAHELALFRLTPLAPDTARINRVLAAWLLRRFAAQWLALVGILVVVLLLVELEQAIVVQSVAIMGYTIVLAGEALRDYSRARRTNLSTRVIWFVTCPVAFFHAALATHDKLPGMLHLALPAAWLVAGCLYTWYRWRRMLAAPPAFPPGRRD